MLDALLAESYSTQKIQVPRTSVAVLKIDLSLLDISVKIAQIPSKTNVIVAKAST